nr:hypothetical protein [Entomoplasma sp. MP1]
MTNGIRMREGYKTGRGAVTIRAKVELEENDRHARFVLLKFHTKLIKLN